VAVAAIAVVAVAAVLWWPNSLSDDPPWGLDQIDMPNPEAEVIAVLQALPAIDGRQPIFDAEFPATNYEPDEQKDWLGIGALSVDAEPLESFAPDVREAEGNTIEATALDPNTDLLWMEFTRDRQTFTFAWADPHGAWLFYATGHTAEFRTRLIHAFIEATGQ
jgi:hypothetical protein